MPQKGLSKADYKVTFATLLREIRPYRTKVVILSLLSIIVSAISAAIPYIAGRIFDELIAISQNPQTLLSYILLLISAWVVLRFISDIFSWRITMGTEELATNVRHRYIAEGVGTLLEMPFSFHKKQKQGSVSEKISRASHVLDNFIDITVRIAPELLTVLLVIVITFFMEPRLWWILLVAIIIYVFILIRSIPGLAELHRKMNKASSNAYGYAWEVMGNISEVKQAVTENHEQKQLRKYFISKAARLWILMFSKWQKLSLAQRILIILTQSTILFYSILLVRDGIITPGELAAFNAYAAMLFGPFVTLGNHWQTIQNGVVTLKETERILQTQKELYSAPGAVVPKRLQGKIEFNGVSFSYEKKKEVLTNITFEAQAGQVVALVGESGVGKTTIVELLLAFYMPEKGTILIDGTNIKKFDLRAYRKRIGIVPQEVTLFNESAEDNIRYGSFEASFEQVKEAARRAHAHEFIENFPKKYKQRVGWRGIKLSTGQKQRIAIARAILRDPDILILDEPTSALDAQTEQYLQESLEELMKGRTTFVIAHRLSTVRKADLILVLDKGQVAEQGTHEELLEKGGIYKNLYELQIGLHE